MFLLKDHFDPKHKYIPYEYVASNWLHGLKQQIIKEQFYFPGGKEVNAHAKDLYIHVRSDKKLAIIIRVVYCS